MTGKIPTYTQDDELIMVYPCEAPLESLHRPESDIRKVKARYRSYFLHMLRVLWRPFPWPRQCSEHP